jgi:hypothetical protein
MVIEFRDLRPMPPRKEMDAALFYCPYIPLAVIQHECLTQLYQATQVTFRTRYDITSN